MAKNTKNVNSGKKKIATRVNRASVKAVTEVRHTAVPKGMSAKPKSAVAEATRDQIARRAYEIYASGTGGSETDNWFRAERELRGI